MNHSHRNLLITIVFLGITFVVPGLQGDQKPYDFTIARLHYDGGGDWYGDPSSLPNLIDFISNHTNISVRPKEVRVKPTDPQLFLYPYLYMTGHGNIRFSDADIRSLRAYLTNGGFLHADDNYGMDESFRREIKRIFPEKAFVELPFDHPIYHMKYDFTNGPPKIHKHDGLPAQGLGIFNNGRLVIYYTYQTDLGDGWEDLDVHHDGPQKHEAALEMGTNIVLYALTH